MESRGKRHHASDLETNLRSLLLFLALSLTGTDTVSAFSTDKVAHLGVGYILGDMYGNLTDRPLLGVGVACLMGALNEACDADEGGRFNKADLFFTVSGSLLAVGVGALKKLSYREKRIERIRHNYRAHTLFPELQNEEGE